MRSFLIAALIASSALLPRARATETILLTAFEPFAGRPVNHSQTVARALARRLKAAHPGLRVEICALPVVYDLAAEVAAGCLAELSQSPTLMLSLGEGDCWIRLESRAHNLDDTPNLADNAGNLRIAQPIDANGPAQLELDMGLARNLDRLTPRERLRVKLSDDAGGFVCNNTAYRMRRFFAESPLLRTRYAFVHVPHGGCASLSDDELAAKILTKLIAH